jgi:threonylcarbamoyladenosine tRNA methylthiotransferase MtaB
VFFVQNFGCRATQADGAEIEQQLRGRGLSRAVSFTQADVVVLNTCTVTSAADQDARAMIRRVHRENPGARILVTGCYAQRAPREVASLPGVTWVLGNSHKHQVGDVVTSNNFISLEKVMLTAPPFTTTGNLFAHTDLTAAPVFTGTDPGSRTRPNLKVQDGCNQGCSFCIIPQVRGQSRSIPLERAVTEAQALARAGFREIVLSGINLGRWGRDLAPPGRFEQLLRALLEHTDMEKIRISSVEPMDWSDELIELVAGSCRIAKHAHVPLQSGSDKILRRMHRKYRPWHYAERIRKIREAMPEAAIGADVMVGFPGESDELFEQSRSFIDHLPFTYLHVFTYSPRPGTPAAGLPDQVPAAVARERNRVLREIGAKKNLEFREGFRGKTLAAITLQRADATYGTDALSDNYLKIRVAGEHPANQWIKVKVGEIGSEDMIGNREYSCEDRQQRVAIPAPATNLPGSGTRQRITSAEERLASPERTRLPA